MRLLRLLAFLIGTVAVSLSGPTAAQAQDDSHTDAHSGGQKGRGIGHSGVGKGRGGAGGTHHGAGSGSSLEEDVFRSDHDDDLHESDSEHSSHSPSGGHDDGASHDEGEAGTHERPEHAGGRGTPGADHDDELHETDPDHETHTPSSGGDADDEHDHDDGGSHESNRPDQAGGGHEPGEDSNH